METVVAGCLAKLYGFPFVLLGAAMGSTTSKIYFQESHQICIKNNFRIQQLEVKKLKYTVLIKIYCILFI